jgi:hypothetical protein
VFPANGKRPLVEHGLHDATTDPDQIHQWWERWPDANVAVRTGRESGLVVIDADGEEGHASLRGLEREHGELPRTLSTVTPRLGGHRYFAHPGGEVRSSAGRLGEGLDVRADGAYIVVPPSVGGNGRSYEVDEAAPVAPLPQWLEGLLTGAPSGPDPAGSADPVGEAIPKGERDATLASLAGSMRRRGMGHEEILAALRVTNRERCKPPKLDRDLERIATSVGRYEPADVRGASAEDGGTDGDRKLQRRPMAAVEARPVTWLWKGLVPLGTVTVLAGLEGLGKSSLVAGNVAADLSRGRLPGAFEGTPVPTLVVSFEEAAETTIKPRLLAARGETNAVYELRVAVDGVPDLVSLPGDVEQIATQVEETGARLLFIDPFMAALPGSVDSYRDQDVRRALAPVARVAEDAEIAVIANMHLTKGKVGEALHRVMGSVAFTAVARSVLVLGLDPADEGDARAARRILAHAKCNVGPLARSLAYSIEGTSIVADGEEISTVKLVYEGECDTLAREVLAPPAVTDPTETDEAEEWLEDELADGEWHEGSAVKGAAEAAGHGAKPLRRARENLGVETRREGFPAVSQWRLSVVPSPSPGDDEGTTAETA